ncbi:hypothetical protein [Escherichia coli]
MTVRLGLAPLLLRWLPLKGGLAGGALRCFLLLCHLSPVSAG